MDYEKIARKYRRKPVVEERSSSATAAGFSRDMIVKLIPHREPFLLIDTIDTVDFEQQTITGSRRIAPGDPIFEGHFPDYAIYPGVLQVEMIGQLAVCYYVLSKDKSLKQEREDAELNVRALKINHALFQHELRPGDEAQIVGKVLEADEFKFQGIGQVVSGGKVCTVVIAEFFIVE